MSEFIVHKKAHFRKKVKRPKSQAAAHSGMMKWTLLLVGILALSVEPASASFFSRLFERHRHEYAYALPNNQESAHVHPWILERVTPDNARVIVSLSRQRAYLLVGNEVAIDSPISTGRAAGMTPTGNFRVQQKDPNHRSSFYGDDVDNRGNVIRANVDERTDRAPSGAHFEGASMSDYMRITECVGLHAGYLPGYPASHGCIRMPASIAPLFYQRIKVGTPVAVIY